MTQWTSVPGGVTAPEGFLAAGLAAGLKPSGQPDLALLWASGPASAAGAFTTNRMRAACVDLCRQRLAAGRPRGVVINAGQANACTGDRGWRDSEAITAAVADRLGVPAEELLICSTGVIGQPIALDPLLKAVPDLVQQLDSGGGAAAARAILTTDLVDKQIALEANLSGRRVRLGGMAKGSGMIHPDMATMLAFVTCDAGVEPALWQAMVARAVAGSFNAITVDGDTSTNDTLLAFAAGEPLPEADLGALEAGLTLVCQHLARAIARDGEGATCLIEVLVRGAAGAPAAARIARTIAGSSLVKTAIHGRDPNWGRIVAAAGRAGEAFDPGAVALWLGPHQLMAGGVPLAFDRAAASGYLREQAETGTYLLSDTVRIGLDVGDGPGEALAWGCDLSAEYVRINADYTT
ncbi:bifunctional glutamate N-acetyltransferase/amino-acid acetyltransferase ArgJ [Synechococcus sp. RSCCF101]|uniref:bifunctional glutamate N-acetyltransferase/amino-acid acetyltransferase ArgJ n=1 Tax=Synechococcus sp. RSCCF101 TaxID=2511069 RepID=UPI001246E665|nr:bifunctional glutamate N-acetyltransferase/amino-acid acetyltransferase ArgJ [Synechococcus sp. RSCCF101]QEY32791.1 bifunctional glutamate N-acetyltransferase/amino-acid acetyltransferase ArgJ [Synechococcus sp. RSCCF101]